MLKRIGLELLVLVAQDIMYTAMIEYPIENEGVKDPVLIRNMILLLTATITDFMKPKMALF